MCVKIVRGLVLAISLQLSLFSSAIFSCNFDYSDKTKIYTNSYIDDNAEGVEMTTSRGYPVVKLAPGTSVNLYNISSRNNYKYRFLYSRPYILNVGKKAYESYKNGKKNWVLQPKCSVQTLSNPKKIKSKKLGGSKKAKENDRTLIITIHKSSRTY